MNPHTANVIAYVLMIFGAYFAPTMVAASRKHASAGAVFALNLFLGWTFIGWVVSLVWALASTRGSRELDRRWNEGDKR